MAASSSSCFCLLPYPQLAKAAGALVGAVSGLRRHYSSNDSNRITDELPLLESREQVLISRGGCAEILKKHSRYR